MATTELYPGRRVVLALTALLVTVAFTWLGARIIRSLSRARSLEASPKVVYLSANQSKSNKQRGFSGARLPEFLLVDVDDLPEQTWTGGDLCAFLRKRGHRICFEEDFQRLADDRPITFRMSTAARPLHQILDELAVGDPHYRWEWVAHSDIVNVIAKRSRLDIRLVKVDRRQRQLIACVGELSSRCQLGYGEFLLGNMKDPGRIENWPFSLNASNVTARDYLNLLANQYEGMSWCVKKGRSVYFEVHPQENFDRIAGQLRSQARKLEK